MHNTDVALFEVVNLGVAKLSQVDITSKDGTTRQTKAYYLPPEQIEYLSPADIIAIYPLNSTDHQSPIKPDLDDAGALAFIHPDAKTYIQTVNGGVSVRTCIMSLLNEDGEHPPSVATPKSFGILAMFKRGKKPITLRAVDLKNRQLTAEEELLLMCTDRVVIRTNNAPHAPDRNQAPRETIILHR